MLIEAIASKIRTVSLKGVVVFTLVLGTLGISINNDKAREAVASMASAAVGGLFALEAPHVRSNNSKKKKVEDEKSEGFVPSKGESAE